MKRLLVYLKQFWKECLLGPLFKLLEASFELCVPLVMKAIIDQGIPNADKDFILKMGGILLLLAAVGCVCAIFAQFFAAKAAVGFAANLRKAIFEHIQSRTYTQIDKLGTSTMMTRITSDVNQVQTGVNLVLRLFLRSPFIVFGAMIMAFTVNVKGALIFAVTIPVLAIVIFAILLASIPLYKKVQGALDQVLNKTRENLTGARVIRAFGTEREEVEDFDEKTEALRKFQLLAGKIGALMNPLTFAVVNAATLFLLWEGAVSVDTGALTQGGLIALINYMAQILVELVKLANLIITVTKSLAGADRIADMLTKEEQTSEVQTKDKGIPSKRISHIEKIEFKNVEFAYQSSAPNFVKDLSFAANKGEMIGIIGGTGCGKTTIVNLIAGFYHATGGTVFVNDTKLEEFDGKEFRDHIGIVPQTAVLFSGTIAQNLKWGNEEASDEDMWEALQTAQAKEFVEQKEGQLEAIVLQNGKNFSGGQRQRLCMARAFIRKGDVLILDDSTSALDYATEAKVRAGIRQLSKDMICFVVSQRAASIVDADKIIVLDEGEVKGIGTHDALLQSCEVYQEIYYSQFPEKKEVSNA